MCLHVSFSLLYLNAVHRPLAAGASSTGGSDIRKTLLDSVSSHSALSDLDRLDQECMLGILKSSIVTTNIAAAATAKSATVAAPCTELQYRCVAIASVLLRITESLRKKLCALP